MEAKQARETRHEGSGIGPASTYASDTNLAEPDLKLCRVIIETLPNILKPSDPRGKADTLYRSWLPVLRDLDWRNLILEVTFADEKIAYQDEFATDLCGQALKVEFHSFGKHYSLLRGVWYVVSPISHHFSLLHLGFFPSMG